MNEFITALSSNSPPDYDSSSSSSGGDHSSPASDGSSAAPYPSQVATPFEDYNTLGMSSASLAGIPGEAAAWNAPHVDSIYGAKGGGDGMIGVEEPSLSLTSDFWSTAPSPVEHRSQSGYSGGGAGTPGGQARSGDMEVEFEEMVQRSSCGPSAASTSAYASPFASAHPMASQSHSSRPATYVSHDQSTPPTDALYISAFSTLSMPVNLMAVNAGIAPGLMGGQPSPPLASVKSEPYHTPVEQDYDQDISVAPSRSSSTSRKGQAEEVEKASTNLVTKDAVVASSIITSILKPSKTTPGLNLLVLGVPAVGAKSRVETQIKISLVLVGAKKGKGRAEGEESDGMVMDDGGLTYGAGDALSRIGSWSHVRLPNYLALKKKNKKQTKPDPPAEDTLQLDVAVYRGSSPHEEVFICTGCRQREHKRAQRKKEARVRPVSDVAETSPMDEEEERRKVVIFNCAEYVEFGAGETVLPTRITCYCRHHKERKGFSIHFTLKTSTGFVVASGQTPPIMITDDHKTSVRPSAAASVAHSADASFDSGGEGVPVKRVAKAKKVKAAPASSTVARPKRATARSSTSRGLVESDDEGPVATAAAKKHGTSKPYDSDARPRKRGSGVHRSPSFAMTPLLTMSKPASPILRAVPDDSNNVPAPMFDSGMHQSEMQSWESALGLGGMGDAVMGDGTSTSSMGPNNTFSPSVAAYSTAATSTAPSPAQSYDWRSSASSPPLSPRPTTAHSSSTDAYPNFYNGLQSPVASPPSLQRNLLSGLGQLYTSTTNSFGALANGTSTMNWNLPQVAAPLPPPRISRLIPGEGPVHGGIEVTVLGENFVRDLVCVFGDSPAVPTHFWSSSTLVCILPPSATPGPVVVGIKGVPLRIEEGQSLQLFTYKDDSDRSLLELALQVVGLKMTGRLEDATAVAMRIVGNSTATSPANSASRHASPTDTAGLASRMSAASALVYDAATPPPSLSRNASFVDLTHFTSSPLSTTVALPAAPLAGGARNFEGIVVKFLSLLDLDPSDIPGSAPSLPLAQSPISHVNAQSHSLLHLATLLGFHRLVQFLLFRGIAVDRADRNGYTALHFAALYGRVAITRLLIEAGANHLVKNLAGQTPLDVALDRDDIDVQEVFHRHRPIVRSISRPQFTSMPGTPISDYARSEISDYSSSAGDSSDDESFHTSDEDTDEEDVERGLSRSASMSSLRSLVTADYDVVAPAKADLVVAGGDRKDPIEVVDLAKAEKDAISATWLAETLKSVVPPSTTSDKPPSSGVWDKMPGLPYANGAWDKIRLPTSFNIPLQMPVAVFPSMASMPAFSKNWIGGKSETEEDNSSSDEASGARRVGMSADGRLVWKNLYGPWWGIAKSSSPPPPMYSATDTLQAPLPALALPPPSPIASTSHLTLTPLPSTSRLPPVSVPAPPPSSMHMQAKLQRRAGYAPTEVTETVVKSYLRHEKVREGLKQDKMLFFFWLPILLFALVCGVYSSLPQIVDTILPWARDLLRS